MKLFKSQLSLSVLRCFQCCFELSSCCFSHYERMTNHLKAAHVTANVQIKYGTASVPNNVIHFGNVAPLVITGELC